MHVPQNTLREKYLETVLLLVEHDPATYARELSFDADQLNFFLNDRARSAEIDKGHCTGRERKKKKEAAERTKEREAKKRRHPRSRSGSPPGTCGPC